MPPLSQNNLDSFQAQLDDIFRRHADFYDALTAAFGQELDRITAQVLSAQMEWLRSSLTLDSKRTIERSPENLIILARLGAEFEKLARKHGYARAIKAFVRQFPEQFALLRETFSVLSYALERPELRRAVLLRKADLNVLQAQQTATIDVLADVPSTIGTRIKQKALQGIGGSTLADMQDMLHAAFARGTADATALGATAMSTFYRVATDRVYERIQLAQKPPLRFIYSGPNDVLTRIFCRRMLAATANGKTWTREEINQLDNGQTGKGTVMDFCGGFNCRHQLLLAV